MINFVRWYAAEGRRLYGEIVPSPDPANRPPPAPVHWLGVDDDWTEAPQLGGLAIIFNQDTYNLPKVQLGLKAQAQQEVVFASYNETKLRHFHTMLRKQLELDD